MLLYVGGAVLLVFLVGSSLLWPPNPLLLRMLSAALLLLSESSGGGGGRKRGEVGLRLTAAWVCALSHGEIPQRPLLVAAGGLSLGRPAGAAMLIVTDAAAAWGDSHRGDRGLGGGCCRWAQRGCQGLQLDLTSAFYLQQQQQ